MTIVTKERKKEIVENLCQNLKEQKAIFFVNFKGITGEQSYNLRKNLNEEGASLVIARKTLAKIAFEKEGIEFDPLSLEGEVGFVFGFEEGVKVAKAIAGFEKEETISILGGIFEGNVLTAEQAKELAELPSREELLARFVGTISAPMSSFVGVLQGNIKGLLQVLSSAKT